MTRHEAILHLEQTRLDATIGLGGYEDTAAYKLCNRDIDLQSLQGLVPDAVLTALGTTPLDWDETMYAL